ncbi:C4-dicarboxylate ABC transporter substrate-binding protein [Pseudomonas daroniae]|uniref:C4-dicarboxylate ABC transporter substrate-binding protein n=1 Tax=Phytopseudomonas daroniae TaxID=2487519 RepID=A0A4Q9QJ78_9GAMM|nr:MULTISPECIES: TAXI family TRAP transporter solute-binding subunit [Pseudomonas]TBU75036.1 C4-dicarboxylate ABC transporter substrate-binding protein [Pseudomonas daroniae]TBU80408.1 C4-dicarboxylate ABC transporter substrate-binding protein [Pseudomonas sp. FRB 228]TBU89135.1 C4-dicarboxylate ABC transporter substrate-binding protein [Pseudomonas daroniae]
MKIRSLPCALSAFAAATVLSCASLSVQAQERFVTIGTGGQTGVYYVAGQSICRFMNRTGAEQGIKCNAPSTAASVFNINALRSGEFNFGFTQADHQFKAYKGLPPFEKQGAMEDLRAVFSMQTEVLTIVARDSARIANFDDLAGKRVNIGVPGSGSRDTFEEIMQAKGWKNSSFALAAELKPAEMASALADNNLDAMTYVVGHPSGAIQEGLSVVASKLIAVDGPDIDKFLEEKTYYIKTEIPAGIYKGVDQPIPSIGGKALLTTSTKTSADTVYLLVKSVFENFDRFKRLHPAFENLTEEEMISTGMSAPLHEGAERYYKERGWL